MVSKLLEALRNREIKNKRTTEDRQQHRLKIDLRAGISGRNHHPSRHDRRNTDVATGYSDRDKART